MVVVRSRRTTSRRVPLKVALGGADDYAGGAAILGEGIFEALLLCAWRRRGLRRDYISIGGIARALFGCGPD